MAGDAADAPTRQHHALGLLVALGIATGSVAALVDAAHRLLLLGPDDRTQLLPAVAPFLDRLAAEPAPHGAPAAPAHHHGGDGCFVATSAEALARLARGGNPGAMTMREASLFILAHLDRLAAPFDVPPSAFGDPVEADSPAPADADPPRADGSVSSSGSTSNGSDTAPASSSAEQQQQQQQRLRRLPFRFDLRPLTFRRLLALVRAHLPHVPTATAANDDDDDLNCSDDPWGPYALLVGLRLLRVNVHHLARHHAARGVRLGPRALRLELLELVMALLDATAQQGEDGPNPGLRAAIQREALALFVAGIEVFYPDGDAQARLLALHLRHHHRASGATPAAAAVRRLLLARLRDLPAMADLVEGATTAPSTHGGGEKAAAVVTPPLPLYYAARHRRGSGASGSSSSLGSTGSGLSLSSGSGGGSSSSSSSTTYSSASSPLSDLIHVLMKLSAAASIQALQGSETGHQQQQQQQLAAASTVATDDAPAILDTMLLYLIGRCGEGDADVDAAATETMAVFLAALVPQARVVLEVRLRVNVYIQQCLSGVT